jgi:hypothetical protein
VRAGENQRIGRWLGEGVGLGRGEERLAASYLAELASDADGPTVTINVGALESGQFTPPQTAETGKEYQRSVSRAHLRRAGPDGPAVSSEDGREQSRGMSGQGDPP